MPLSRFVFVVDAGPEIGGGHVMRSLSLAGALAGRGADCAFVATEHVAAILDSFDSGGMRRIPVAPSAAPALMRAAATQGEAWRAEGTLIIDHYGIDAEAEQAARASFSRMAVIDDLANRPHVVDVLVDPSIGRIAASYEELVPPACLVLTGPLYALLRPQFRQARAATLPGRNPRRDVESALISLGLTDVRSITRRVLDCILDEMRGIQLHVVISSRAPGRAELERLASTRRNITLHVDVTDVAGLMSEADVAIGAGGSSAWERACLGLPSITVTLAQNQKFVSGELARRGVTLLADESASDFAQTLAGQWRALLTSAETREQLSVNSAALCDGLGAERVADALMGPT